MNWKGVVLHHSASHDVSANTIDGWHKERGWDGVGYHFVIRFDGSIEVARDWKKAGAHAVGRNTTHLGICFTGDFTKHSPTEDQMRAGIYLCRGLKERFNLSSFEIHHEQCPGPNFPFEEFVKAINDKNAPIPLVNQTKEETKLATNNAFFDDVDPNHWANEAIGAVVKAGIMNGTSADTFNPNGTLTRAELAVILQRALNL